MIIGILEWRIISLPYPTPSGYNYKNYRNISWTNPGPTGHGKHDIANDMIHTHVLHPPREAGTRLDQDESIKAANHVLAYY
jgi:hypothetical protein